MKPESLYPGIIPVDAIQYEWEWAREADYGYPQDHEIACPRCGGTPLLKGVEWGDVIHCRECHHPFELVPKEEHRIGWKYDDHRFTMSQEIDSDIVQVLKSLHFTYARNGNLEDIDLKNGVPTFCPGPSWFPNALTPFPIFRVADGTEVGNEELDEFYKAYVEAALWSSTDNSDESGGEPLDKNYDEDDLADETRNQMMEDCRAFLVRNYNRIYPRFARAGHDFWLTRCGHGSGYWDGDWPEHGQKLTEESKVFGNVDLIVGDDGKIYC